LEGNQTMLLQVIDIDLEPFGFDDLLKMFKNNVFIGSVDNYSYRLILLVVTGNGVVDDAGLLVEEHCQVTLGHSIFVSSYINI